MTIHLSRLVRRLVNRRPKLEDAKRAVDDCRLPTAAKPKTGSDFCNLGELVSTLGHQTLLKDAGGVKVWVKQMLASNDQL
jgi:hypothetical protein